MSELSVYQIVRPFAWIAAAAFAVGFAGYVAMGRHHDDPYGRLPASAVVSTAPAQPA